MTHGIQKHLQCKKKKNEGLVLKCVPERKSDNLLVEIKTVVLALPWANKRANSKPKCAYICSWLFVSHISCPLGIKRTSDVPLRQIKSVIHLDRLSISAHVLLSRHGPGYPFSCLRLIKSAFGFIRLCVTKAAVYCSHSLCTQRPFWLFTEGPVEPTEPSLKSPWGWLAVRGANRLKWCFFGAVRLELR